MLKILTMGKRNKFILLLCALSLAVYLNSLGNGFVLDDDALVADNPLIKSGRLLNWVFSSALYEYPHKSGSIAPFDAMYRPLQILSYSVDYKIWQTQAAGFRFTNIVIHALNAILIYLLFSLLFNNSLAKIVSILFVVHPAQVSVVSYISSRADLLVSFFMLLSIISFVKFIQDKRGRYYIYSLICATLALFCRENALILFAIILLILVLKKVKSRRFSYLLPFLAVDLVYLILRFIILGNQALILHQGAISLFLRIVNFLNIALRYLLILFLPFNMHMLRTTPFIGIFDFRALFAAGFLILYIYLLRRFRKVDYVFFSMLWFIIWLIPVFFFLDGFSGLRQAMMSESWLYLAGAGFFTVFYAIKEKFKEIGKMFFVLAVIFYSCVTIIYNSYWKSDIAIYKNTLKYLPERNTLRINLARECLKCGLYKDAFAEIKRIAEYYPESSIRYILEGEYYYFTNNIPRAIEKYRTASVINQNNFQIFYGLSLCYEKSKQPDKAIAFALRSLRLNPYHLEGLIRLGDLYLQKKDPKEAMRYYRTALRIDPANKALIAKIKRCKASE